MATLRGHHQSAQLDKVEAEAGEHHLHPYLKQHSHQNVPGVENPFDDGEGPIPGDPPPVDTPVPQPVPDAERTTPHPPPHRRIEAPGLDAARLRAPRAPPPLSLSHDDGV